MKVEIRQHSHHNTLLSWKPHIPRISRANFLIYVNFVIAIFIVHQCSERTRAGKNKVHKGEYNELDNNIRTKGGDCIVALSLNSHTGKQKFHISQFLGIAVAEKLVWDFDIIEGFLR